MRQFMIPFAKAGIAHFSCDTLWLAMTARSADDEYHRANDAQTINTMAEMLYRAARVTWTKYHLRVIVAGQFRPWGSETHDQIVSENMHSYCKKKAGS